LALAQAAPQDEGGPNHGRGLLNFYDSQILANRHLNVPLHTPHFLAEDQIQMGLYLDWANTFARRDSEGYFLDGEVLHFHPRVRFGIDADLEFGLELPIFYRGGGILDPLIEGFHDAFGLGDNHDGFPPNRYRASLTVGGETITPDAGFGLGDLAVWTKVRLWDPRGAWAAGAFAATLKLPTGTADFDSDGLDIALTLAFSKSFTDWFHAYVGGGFIYYTDTETQGLRYHSGNWMSFAGVEFDLWSDLSLVLQTTIQSPMMTEPRAFDEERFSVAVGVQWAPWEDDRTFEFGVVENLVTYQPTADFQFHIGFRQTF
jgi:hypothetical protein